MKRQRLLGQYGSNPYVRAAVGTYNMLGTGVRYAQKAYKAYRKVVKPRTGVTPPVSSFQNDNVPRYRYKRMPGRKRRSWKRFTKRVKHVTLQMQPLQIYTDSQLQSQSTLTGEGGAYSMMCGGTFTLNNDEIYRMFQGAYNVATNAACAPYKLFLKSLVLDMMITNTGSNTAIIDVYHLKCRNEVQGSFTLHTQWTNAIGELAADATGGTVSAVDPCITLFDAPNFCSYWKVISKREIILGVGQTTSMQIRIPTNRHVDGKELVTAPQALRNFTQAFFIQWHGAPTATGFGATTLQFGTTKVGHYAIPPGKITEAGRST